MADELVVRHWQRIFPDADLDGHFPKAGRADQRFVTWILDQRAGSGAKRSIPEHKPEPCVRIEQELHGMYSVKSFKCSSSSEMIVNIPLQDPKTGVDLTSA